MDNDVTKFGSFDILSDPSVREDLKHFSKWKTYPQVFVKGEFFGGLDILQDMHIDGKLLASLPEDCFGQVSGSGKLDLIVAEPGVILVCQGTLADAKNAALLAPLVKLEVPFKLYDCNTGRMHVYKPPTDLSGSATDKAFETVDAQKQAVLGAKVAKVVSETHAALRAHEQKQGAVDADGEDLAFPLLYVDRKHIGHGASSFKDVEALKELVKRYLPKEAATTASANTTTAPHPPSSSSSSSSSSAAATASTSPGETKS